MLTLIFLKFKDLQSDPNLNSLFDNLYNYVFDQDFLMFVTAWNQDICAQCGNFRIFLHLRFFVKAIWILWSFKNCHFDHFSSTEFWIFGIFLHFQVWNFQIPKNRNSKLPKLLKRQVLNFWNWFHVKSEMQEIY